MKYTLLDGRIEYEITNTGCWQVVSHKPNGSGYPCMSFKGKVNSCHRIVYTNLILKSELPTEIDVCHTCDNRKCVNPEHLFHADAQTNLDDMVNKGRSNRGELRAMAKLTEEDVVYIRQAFSCGYKNQRQLAEMFDISFQTISKVINNQIWKHIKI